MGIGPKVVAFRVSRILWMPRVALAITLGFFVVAGLAHAAHVHKNDSTQGHAVHCGLCIQLDRAAAPPAAPRLPELASTYVRIPVTRSALPTVCFLTHPYEARGPPPTA